MKDQRLQFRISADRLAELDCKLKQDGYTSRAEWFNELLRKYLKEGSEIK